MMTGTSLPATAVQVGPTAILPRNCTVSTDPMRLVTGSLHMAPEQRQPCLPCHPQDRYPGVYGMAVDTVAGLKAKMPPNTPGGTTVADIHDLIDTVAEFTTQEVVTKT